MRRCTVLFILALGLLAGCGRTVGPAPYELHTHPGPPTVSEPLGPHPDRVKVAERRHALWRVAALRRADARHHRRQPTCTALSAASPARPWPCRRFAPTWCAPATRSPPSRGTTASTPARSPRPTISRRPTSSARGETLVLAGAGRDRRAAFAPSPAPVLPPPPHRDRWQRPPHARPAAPAGAGRQRSTVPPPPATGLPAPQRAGGRAPPKPDASRVATAGRRRCAALRAAGRGRFSGRCRGRIVGSFGSGPSGTHNDGINIAAPSGTPVLAADAGDRRLCRQRAAAATAISS